MQRTPSHNRGSQYRVGAYVGADIEKVILRSKVSEEKAHHVEIEQPGVEYAAGGRVVSVALENAIARYLDVPIAADAALVDLPGRVAQDCPQPPAAI